MGTFLILGGVTLNTLVFFTMCFINRNKSKKTEKNACDKVVGEGNVQSKQSVSFKSLRCGMKNAILKSKKYISKPYLFILVATGILMSALDGYVSLLLDIALWKRIDSSRALFSFVIYSISSSVSCLIPGLLKQKKGMDSYLYPICSAMAGGIGQLIVYLTKGYIAYLIGTSLVGAAHGGILSSSMNAVVKMVELEFVPVATGLLLTVEGLLAIGAGPLFGWIRDATGSYGGVLITIVTIHGISAFLYILALIFRRLYKTRARPAEITESAESPARNENENLMQ